MKSKRVHLVITCLAILGLSVVATAEGLPRVEFGIGAGFASYDIDCSYTGPNLSYGGFTIRDYSSAEAALQYSGDANKPQHYPFAENIAAIHTDFLVRQPLTANLAIAYSNRVNFAFADRIHRGDYYNSYGPILTILGLTGVEVECYLMPGFSGPWVSGLVGATVLNQPFAKGYFTQLGFGAGGTFGWRMSKNGAFALDAIYQMTFIPGWTQDKVAEAGGSIEGQSSGLNVSAAYRIGF